MMHGTYGTFYVTPEKWGGEKCKGRYVHIGVELQNCRNCRSEPRGAEAAQKPDIFGHRTAAKVPAEVPWPGRCASCGALDGPAGPAPCGIAKGVPCQTARKAGGRARAAALAVQRGKVHRCPPDRLWVLSSPARVTGASLGGPPFLYNDRSDKGGNLYLYSALSGQDGKGQQSARGIGAVAGQLRFAARPDARRQRRNRLGIEQWPGGMVPPTLTVNSAGEPATNGGR